MEDYLGNVTIGKVYEGKSGEGEYGKWKAWNFYVEGDERRFSYFSGGKKPEPFEGAFIKMAKLETVVKGKYTNHNIKEMALESQNNEPRQDPPDDYEPPGEPAKETQYVPLPKQKKDVSYSFFPKQAVDANTVWLTTGNFPTDLSFDAFIDSIIRTTDKMYDAAIRKINE